MKRSKTLSWIAAGVCAVLIIVATGGPAPAQAAERASLSSAEAVRQALEQSPVAAAARSRLEATAAGLRGARAPYPLQGELAPGVGFTNGNALLSQRLDLAGRRSAETRLATGERAAAAAELDQVRLQVAADALAAYFDLARAQAVEAAAAESAGLARQIRDAVRRRVEIGEAPAVQATRAEIELARAEQELARAGGDVRARRATLNLLLGRSPEAPVMLTDALAAPAAPAEPSALVEQARRQRPELAQALARVEARRGAVDVARAQGRPDLLAELASDIWSLDRDPSRSSRNFGFQARLSFPLFNRGRLRAEVERARAGVREEEARLEAARRNLTVEVERAAAELSASREVALNYQQTILPRSQELLQATRAGFETGLSSFLEVLEAQRVARQTQTEYQSALFDAVRARIALDRALGAVPGLGLAAPSTQPR
jgi:cobalt-zinc-cadmium efflux system outer membrane protein